MSDSAFDLDSFMSASVNEPSVKRPPIPKGTVLQSVIEKAVPRQWTKKDDPSKSGVAVDIFHKVDLSGNPDLVQLLGGLTSLQMKHGVMLDLTPDGKISNIAGANRGMRAYREALDLNKPGDTFNWNMVTGRFVKVKIGQRIDQQTNEVFDEIADVARAF